MLKCIKNDWYISCNIYKINSQYLEYNKYYLDNIIHETIQVISSLLGLHNMQYFFKLYINISLLKEKIILYIKIIFQETNNRGNDKNYVKLKNMSILYNSGLFKKW